MYHIIIKLYLIIIIYLNYNTSNNRIRMKKLIFLFYNLHIKFILNSLYFLLSYKINKIIKIFNELVLLYVYFFILRYKEKIKYNFLRSIYFHVRYK